MTEKVRLDIPLLLPDVKDEADACVERLTSELQGREGVSEAHIVPAPGNGNAQLCIHYDPDFLPLARVRQLATSAGAAITGQYGHIRSAEPTSEPQSLIRTSSADFRLIKK